MRIALFEDHGANDLEPLTLTRPVFELYCGLSPLSTKQCRYFTSRVGAVLVRPHLAEFTRQRRPDWHVNDGSWLLEGPSLLVNGRWLPPSDQLRELNRPVAAMVGDELAWAFITPDVLTSHSVDEVDDLIDRMLRSLPKVQAGGSMIGRPWDLIEHNGNEITRDFLARGDKGSSARPMDFSLVGPAGRLSIDPSARIDPLVVADTTNGPVVIDRDVVVTAFTRLEGPCYIGPGTQLMGAKVRAGTSFGPYCRVGGEVECSIIQGFTNKYHDGFLGHSYLGEWVNVGAGTQTSDLRNDYGEIILTQSGRRIQTGCCKIGSFIGDHCKIGIGSLLNTGTNFGAFTNILPAGRLLPRYVPSFCDVKFGTISENTNIESLFETAEEVLRRRGVAWTEEREEMYRSVFEQTTATRRNSIGETEMPRYRQSA